MMRMNNEMMWSSNGFEPIFVEETRNVFEYNRCRHQSCQNKKHQNVKSLQTARFKQLTFPRLQNCDVKDFCPTENRIANHILVWISFQLFVCIHSISIIHTQNLGHSASASFCICNLHRKSAENRIECRQAKRSRIRSIRCSRI